MDECCDDESGRRRKPFLEFKNSFNQLLLKINFDDDIWEKIIGRKGRHEGMYECMNFALQYLFGAI